MPMEIGGEKIGNNFSLKQQSKYYLQVQVQMFVAELQSCVFVVWTEQGIFSVAVLHDSEFIKTVLHQLGHVLEASCSTINGTEAGKDRRLWKKYVVVSIIVGMFVHYL